MKTLFLLLSLSLFACGAPKNTESSKEGKTTGVIVVSDACTYIKVNIEKNIVTMYPVNLDEEFKKSDLKITFDYALSRAPQPADCIVDKVVSVSNVSIK